MFCLRTVVPLAVAKRTHLLLGFDKHKVDNTLSDFCGWLLGQRIRDNKKDCKPKPTALEHSFL